VKEKQRKYSHLLPLVTEARIYRDRNDWWEMEITTSEPLDENLRYIFVPGTNTGCFIGTDPTESVIDCFMHSGLLRNERGYGGREFHLRMKDGTERTIRGPWSGRPGVWMQYGAPDCMQVSYNLQDGDFHQITLSVEFLRAIINKFNLNFVISVIAKEDDEYRSEFPYEWRWEIQPNN